MKYKLNRENLSPFRRHNILDGKYFSFDFETFYESNNSNYIGLISLKSPEGPDHNMIFRPSELISEKDEHNEDFNNKIEEMLK
jgi:hypothetical protein